MTKSIAFRPVTMRDAQLLLDWRNDSETRKASHNPEPISLEQHLRWLSQSLQSPSRRMLIAEYNHKAVGTVRADLEGSEWTLSWTVAPEARGLGYAKSMVALFCRQFSEALRAEVKTSNKASARIAEYAGLSFVSEKNGIAVYVREKSDEH